MGSMLPYIAAPWILWAMAGGCLGDVGYTLNGAFHGMRKL